MNSAKQVLKPRQLARSIDNPSVVIKKVFSLAAALSPTEQEKLVRAEISNPDVTAEVLELLHWDQQDHQLLDLDIDQCLTDCLDPTLSKIQEDLPPHVAGYDHLKFLTEGGQSVVYKAIQTSTRRQVVIKFLKISAGPNAGQRMRNDREIAVLSKLQHPNILSVLDCGTTQDKRDYYVVRYIKGHDLDKYIARTQLSSEHALQLCVRIIETMDTAHRHGVIHRDLKPSNVRVDTNGQPLILDFGLAKAELRDRHTSDIASSTPGAFMGSVPWASPEQVDHSIGELSNRSDIDQLGLICYEVFSRGQPHSCRQPSSVGLAQSFLQVFLHISMRRYAKSCGARGARRRIQSPPLE